MSSDTLYSIAVIQDTESGRETALHFSKIDPIGLASKSITDNLSTKMIAGEMSRDELPMDGAEIQLSQCWYGTIIINCSGLNIEALHDDTQVLVN
jgi:hypothetical protein